MSWIADAGMATVALWVTLLLTGMVAGTFAARWNPPLAGDRQGDRMLLAAAGAGVVAFCANAGALLGSSTGNALLTAHVPVATRAGFRLAVLWSTLPGAALTFAVIILVYAALRASRRAPAATRSGAVLTLAALLALGMAAWFAPPPNAVATGIPPFVQAPAAAAAPALALLSVVLLLFAVAARVGGTVAIRVQLIAAWMLATLAITAEQVARSELGIGPRDAIIFGSASSGLLLWLVTSALLHRRVQGMMLRTPRQFAPAHRGTMLAHLGAVFMAVSFGAHALASRSNVALPPGGSVSVTDAFRRSWQLANQGISRFDAEGVDVVSVAVEVKRPSGTTTLLTPEIRDYHTPAGQHVENSVLLRKSTGRLTQALRVLLISTDSLDVASLRVTFLPLPILWPIGVALLLLSVVVQRGEANRTLADE